MGGGGVGGGGGDGTNGRLVMDEHSDLRKKSRAMLEGKVVAAVEPPTPAVTSFSAAADVRLVLRGDRGVSGGLAQRWRADEDGGRCLDAGESGRGGGGGGDSWERDASTVAAETGGRGRVAESEADSSTSAGRTDADAVGETAQEGGRDKPLPSEGEGGGGSGVGGCGCGAEAEAMRLSTGDTTAANAVSAIIAAGVQPSVAGGEQEDDGDGGGETVLSAACASVSATSSRIGEMIERRRMADSDCARATSLPAAAMVPTCTPSSPEPAPTPPTSHALLPGVATRASNGKGAAKSGVVRGTPAPVVMSTRSAVWRLHALRGVDAREGVVEGRTPAPQPALQGVAGGGGRDMAGEEEAADGVSGGVVRVGESNEGSGAPGGVNVGGWTWK